MGQNNAGQHNSGQATTVHGSASHAKILLVDPEVLVRHALANLIDSIDGCTVCGHANTAAEALEELRARPFEIVMCEIALPRESGIDFLLEIQRKKVTVKPMVLSHVDSEDMITQALLAGALGYVFKGGPVEDLVNALNVVRAGNRRFLPQSIAHLSEVSTNRYALGESSQPSDPLSPLSAREREIFHLLATGLQNTAIAKKLFISPRTVETHRARIVRKLSLSTNGELIRFAIKHGLSMP